MKSSRFFRSIEHHEGRDVFSDVCRFLGDDVLTYASDHPHSECRFPDSVANIVARVEPRTGPAAQIAGGECEPFLPADVVLPR